MSTLKRLKVCFVAGTLGQGGAERQLFYQLQTLKRAGAQPSVVSFSSGEYWQAPIERMGIPVTTLPRHLSRMGRLARMLPVIRRGAPAIIQSAHFYANLYAVLAARCCGAREIGAIRNDATSDVADAGVPGGLLSLRMPHWLASNSRNAMENAVRLGRNPTRLVLLPNVVDIERFRPDDDRSGQEIHILMVGRLVRQKRFDTFLQLLSNINQRPGPKAVGHIVGDGPNMSALRALAAELGLRDGQVRFHGSVPDVERIYRRADLCIHLSDWEGLPNSILEAMACGVPVVASRVGGVPEIVEDGGSGFLVGADDMGGLETTVLRLMIDPGLRRSMGQKGLEFVARHHSLPSLQSNLESLYEAVLNA